jgi:hypothetical protein
MKKTQYIKKKYMFISSMEITFKVIQSSNSMFGREERRSQSDIDDLPVRHRRNQPMGPVGCDDPPTFEDQGTKAIWSPTFESCCRFFSTSS